MQDGDTIAIGGFIQESTATASNRVFRCCTGFRSWARRSARKTTARARTELVVFLTPRVIYDTAQIQDATDEIKGNLKKLQKMMRDQQ